MAGDHHLKSCAYSPLAELLGPPREARLPMHCERHTAGDRTRYECRQSYERAENRFCLTAARTAEGEPD